MKPSQTSELDKKTLEWVVREIEKYADTHGRPVNDEYYGVGEADLAYRATVYLACQDIRNHIKSIIKEE